MFELPLENREKLVKTFLKVKFGAKSSVLSALTILIFFQEDYLNNEKPVWKHESSGFYIYNVGNWHIERNMGSNFASMWSPNSL